DAPRELRNELEVLVPMPAGLGRGDREHAEPLATRLERDDDQRARLHADELLFARSCDLLQRPLQCRPVGRLASAEDLDDMDARWFAIVRERSTSRSLQSCGASR